MLQFHNFQMDKPVVMCINWLTASEAKAYHAMVQRLIDYYIEHKQPVAAELYEALNEDCYLVARPLVFEPLKPPENVRVKYEEYIRSPEWHEKAAAIKKKFGGRCQACNSNVKVQVHHRTYERLGHELDTDLTVLCEHCHKLFHGIEVVK